MNRLNDLRTPMIPLAEDHNDTDAIRQNKIDFIKLRELSKSPHCIGSVNDIETKVSELEKQIKTFQTNFQWNCSDSEEDLEQTDVKKVVYDQKDRKEVAQFAGVFSVVTTYSFNKPERIKKIAKMSTKPNRDSKKNTDKKALPKFIELCEYPGFDNGEYTALPCNISPSFILQRVYRAQPYPFIDTFKKFFEKWFLSSYMENILQDIFWFFFIVKYGSDLNKKDLSNYFSRTASNYVTFLYKIGNESLYHQEKFKKKLPNLISQVLYAALSESFPDSWIQFDEDFIERIILLVYFWFSGIRCTKGIWKSWNMHALKPTEQRKREKVIEEQSKLGYTDFKADKKIKDGHYVERNKVMKSTYIGPLNNSKCVLLNLNGQSPLVQYYLQNKAVSTTIGTNFVIKHKELIPIKPNESSRTYSEIIKESLKDQKNCSEKFRKIHKINSLELNKFLISQKATSLDNERKQEKLLMNKKVVHNLSNVMMHEFLKDKDSISFNADALVRETIAAIE